MFLLVTATFVIMKTLCFTSIFYLSRNNKPATAFVTMLPALTITLTYLVYALTVFPGFTTVLGVITLNLFLLTLSHLLAK